MVTPPRDREGETPADPGRRRGTARPGNGGGKQARGNGSGNNTGSGNGNATKSGVAGEAAVARPRSQGDNAAPGAQGAARKRAAAAARRRLNAEPVATVMPVAPEGSLLTAAQMREARRIMRERQVAARKEREFGERLLTTLTEGQNALNIAFGAILSAYVGTMLAAIDDKPFNQLTLAFFFVLIGVFIGGLCIGNLILLRRHYGLGISFLAAGALAAWFSLETAAMLGFELPILKVMYVCWYAMLIATDGLLTGIIFLHHRSVTRRAG